MRLPRSSDEVPDATSVERGFSLTAALLLVSLVVTLGAQLPGATSVPFLRAQRGTYRAIWPQGWSYFSDVPSQDILVAYRVDTAGNLGVSLTRRAASADQQWGLSRGGYAQLVEVYDLARQVPPERWVQCPDTPPPACDDLAGRSAVSQLANRSRRPTLCGRIALVDERPVAWDARRRTGHAARRAIRVVIVESTCRGEGRNEP